MGVFLSHCSIQLLNQILIKVERLMFDHRRFKKQDNLFSVDKLWPNILFKCWLKCWLVQLKAFCMMMEMQKLGKSFTSTWPLANIKQQWQFSAANT